MALSIKKRETAEILYFLVILSALLLLILYPEIYSESIRQGLTAFYNNAVPLLFPFFILTGILSSFNILEKAGTKLTPLMKKAYNTDGTSGFIFLIGAISGYPIGARLIYDMYFCGKITQGEAARITAFCSVSGPMFILGSMGIMLHNKFYAAIILTAHLFGALINGFIYRKYKIKNTIREQNAQNIQTTDRVYSAVISLLIVGGFIAVFFMISDMLLNTGLLNPVIYLFKLVFPENTAKGLTLGIIEMTRGCMELSKGGGIFAVVTCCAVISWGGISVNMQAYTYLKKCNIKLSYFLLTKLTHCIISTAICALLLKFFAGL